MEIEVIQKGNLFVNQAFSELLDTSGLTSFDDFMRLEGVVVKSAVRDRSTHRLDLQGVTVYIKKHLFPGIREILKNFLRFRFPPGALNEWQALLAFHAHNIPTMSPICAGTNGRHGGNIVSVKRQKCLPFVQCSRGKSETKKIF